VALDHLRFETDTFERMKPFAAKNEDCVGVTHLLPRTTNESKQHFYNNQGESIYSNPWPFNLAFMDHALDEEKIWNFHKTLYGFDVIRNMWTHAPNIAKNLSFSPNWSGKLAIEHFMTSKKYKKLLLQTELRDGLNEIQKRHAEVLETASVEQVGLRESMEKEVNDYVNDSYKRNQEFAEEGFTVTDHSHQPRQLLTSTQSEDQEYYDLLKSMEEYNSSTPNKKLSSKNLQRYERGSFLQKLLDPFQDAKIQEDGTLVYEMKDSERNNRTEAEYRSLFDKLQKNETEAFECDEGDDEEEGRVAILKDFDEENDAQLTENMRKMDEQFAVFLEGEDYSAVKDMHKAYSYELRRSEADRILEKIPDHVFWDVKKPLNLQ